MTIKEILEKQNKLIQFDGPILNGERDIRQELDINNRTILNSNIKRSLEDPLDPVLASHLHWGGRGGK